MSKKTDTEAVELARDWLARKYGIATTENGDTLARAVLDLDATDDTNQELITLLHTETADLRKERDAARAEVERWKGKTAARKVRLDRIMEKLGLTDWLNIDDEIETLLITVETLKDAPQSWDELQLKLVESAHREVERLRGVIESIHAASNGRVPGCPACKEADSGTETTKAT